VAKIKGFNVSEIITKNINNKELSILLSKFWKFDELPNVDMFDNYKQLKNDIIIEHVISKKLTKDNIYVDIHNFCYYWYEDSLTQIFEKRLEPSMMHTFNVRELNSRFYREFGKKYNFKFKLNYMISGDFLKGCTIVMLEKKNDFNKEILGKKTK